VDDVPIHDTEAAWTGPELAYVVLRLILGVNLAMHGLVRLFGDYAGFAEGIIDTFRDTVLPGLLLAPFAYGLPVIELLLGVLLLLGLWTRTTLVAGGALIGVLVFGSSLLQNWGTVGTQMIYALTFYVLLFHVRHNRFALDALRSSR
jgi:thiosulfate dehydrogenase [quinone] large subunit